MASARNRHRSRCWARYAVPRYSRDLVPIPRRIAGCWINWYRNSVPQRYSIGRSMDRSAVDYCGGPNDYQPRRVLVWHIAQPWQHDVVATDGFSRSAKRHHPRYLADYSWGTVSEHLRSVFISVHRHRTCCSDQVSLGVLECREHNVLPRILRQWHHGRHRCLLRYRRNATVLVDIACSHPLVYCVQRHRRQPMSHL